MKDILSMEDTRSICTTMRVWVIPMLEDAEDMLREIQWEDMQMEVLITQERAVILVMMATQERA